MRIGDSFIFISLISNPKRMKSLLTLSIRLSLIFFSLQLGGQNTFSKVYQDSNLNHAVYSGMVLSASDNGFLIAGNNNLIRFDSVGNVVWSKVLGSNGSIGTIIQNKDTTYYFLTNGQYSGNTVPVLTKMNAHGGLIWSRVVDYGSYQNCVPLSASATIDSGVVICGYGYPTSQTINSFVSRFDKQGNLIWSRTMSVGDTSTIYRSIKQTPDSGFVMIGTLNSNTASLIKLSKSGTINWCKQYVSLDSTNALGVEVVVNNNKLYSYCIIGKPVFVVCGLAGNYISAKAFNMPYYHNPLFQYRSCTLSSTSNNGFLMTSDTYAHELVLKIDSLSNLEWAASNYLYGSLTATQLSDKGYMIAGGGPFLAVKTSFIPDQIGVIKLDSLGKGGYCTSGANISVSTVSLSATPRNYTLTQLGSIQSTTLSVTSIAVIQRTGCINSINPGVIEYGNLNSNFIYPNPSSGIISIQFKNDFTSPLKYSIINLNGEIVKEEISDKNVSEYTMDCSSLAPAVYILRLSDKNGMIATKRLIIKP